MKGLAEKMTVRNFIALKVMVCLLLQTALVQAQQTDSVWTASDTLSATVKAYETNRSVNKVPAAVSVLNYQSMLRFTNNSMVSAMNTQPGVRMEERSPGSYRLNLRGSSLRSPFGIRNVKVYLNEIPFTDPGGNTYLNVLDFHSFSSVEVVKGPASSLYGAGSGGAMLLHTLPNQFEPGAEVDLLGGSYGLFGVHAAANFGSEKSANKIEYAHQQSDGWRNHTNMRRDVATYQNKLQVSERQTLQTIALYGNLYYQTPGALTLAQYKQNPRASRPAGGPFPSAEAAKAAIHQQYFLAGVTNTYDITSRWKNTTAVYGSGSWFENPTFRLYEKRTEPHVGARTFFSNEIVAGKSLFHIVYGAEAQKGIFGSQTFKINAGNPDTILTSDEINNWRYSIFTQAEWLFNDSWNITAGISYDKSYVGIDRLLINPITTQGRTFRSEFSPRIAVMKSFKSINIYATATKGFSPPTTAELLPGTGVINTTLKAEHGINYEAGVKGNLLQNRLMFDIAAYHFYLNDAISQRRDASGGDYYINAGKTKQNGIEALVKFQAIKNTNGFIKMLDIAEAYTGNFYEYVDYKVIEADYGGKQLPGIPKYTFVTSLNMLTKPGLYANITLQLTDKIALNDANTAFADDYQLLSIRLGWQLSTKKHYGLDLFVAGDNLLDETYSLGNDINAVGGRYYNAASGRNFSAGISLKFRHKNKTASE